MTTKTQSMVHRCFAPGAGRRLLLLAALVVLALGGAIGCSPYASVNVGVPLKVGPVYVNPSIGVGGYL